MILEELHNITCFDPNILKIRLVLISPNCRASWIELFWRYNISQKSPQIARYRPVIIIVIVLFLRLLYCHFYNWNYHFIVPHLKSDHVVGSVCVLNAVLSLSCLPQRVLENILVVSVSSWRGWVQIRRQAYPDIFLSFWSIQLNQIPSWFVPRRNRQ